MNAYGNKTLGIIGGMGPAATADFYTKLVAATPAHDDQSHIPVLIHADPSIPSRIDSIAGVGPDPGFSLVSAAQRLCGLGAQVLVMPCNTAHYWYNRIDEQVHVPFVHVVDAVIAQLHRAVPSPTRVGLLATSATVQTRLYHDRAAALTGSLSEYGRNLEFVVPDTTTQTALVDAAIAAAKSGRWQDARFLLSSATARLQRCGVQAIIAGCTEIPLALAQERLDVPLIDSCDALALACITQCMTQPQRPAETVATHASTAQNTKSMTQDRHALIA